MANGGPYSNFSEVWKQISEYVDRIYRTQELSVNTHMELYT